MPTKMNDSTVFLRELTLLILFSCRVATVEQLKQFYVLMSADVKDAYMMHVLDVYCEAHPKSSIMIFTSTCKYVLIICISLGTVQYVF